MRKEGEITKEFLDFIRQAAPGIVCLKHSDRFTKGIPDASITAGGGHSTLWLEVKRFTSAQQHLDKVRSWVDNLPQLDTAVRLNGYYLVADLIRGEYLFQRARQIWAAHRQNELLLPPLEAYHELRFCTPARHAAWGKIFLSISKILQGAEK